MTDPAMIKPPLSTLAHYGTKGMKWGVRNSSPTTSEIKGARSRQLIRARDFPNKKDEFATSEDRVTSQHMTNGEKVIAAVMAGPLGLVVIGRNRTLIKKAARATDEARRNVS